MNKLTVIICAALIVGSAVASAKEPVDSKERRVVRLRDGQVLVDGEAVRRGYLGVQLMSMTDELRQHFGAPKETGVLVSSISVDSPAAKSGLRVGDIITAIEGKPATSVGAVERAIRSKKDGERVQIEFVRDRISRAVTAEIDEREARLMDLSGLEHLPALIDGELLREGAEQFQKAVSSPEFREKMSKLGDCVSVQGRIRDLEKRLEELEKKR